MTEQSILEFVQKEEESIPANGSLKRCSACGSSLARIVYDEIMNDDDGTIDGVNYIFICAKCGNFIDSTYEHWDNEIGSDQDLRSIREKLLERIAYDEKIEDRKGKLIDDLAKYLSKE